MIEILPVILKPIPGKPLSPVNPGSPRSPVYPGTPFRPDVPEKPLKWTNQLDLYQMLCNELQ